MSRWKKRSAEDKIRIAREQEDIRKKKSSPISSPSIKDDSYNRNKILSGGEIPLICIKDGYVVSEKYNLVNKQSPLSATSELCVIGKCPKCGKELKSFLIPSILGVDNMMIIMLIINNLIIKGRLVDLR